MSTQFNTVTERNRSVNWKARQVMWSLLGMGLLFMAFTAIQSNMSFEDDLGRRIFLQNWAPLISILGFGAGWFTVHLIEATVKANRRRMTLFFTVILMAGMFSPILIRFLVDSYWVGNLISNCAQLVMSSAMLRLSKFQPETISALRKMFPWAR